MKTAIIVGSSGQDGKIAFDFLLKRNYRLIGVDKEELKCAGIQWDSEIDIRDNNCVSDLIDKTKPDEVYYFAAYHHSSEDCVLQDQELFGASYAINVFAVINFLEGIRKYSPDTRLFNAGSSLCFGDAATEIQNEDTPFNPDTIYGITKLDGLMACRFYRSAHGIFASTGIFYNHESCYRSDKFVTMKIIKGAIAIKNGLQDKLIVGDLNAEVDWGYAPDYVDAAHRILNIDEAGDFIIATGIKHSVRDFVRITFDYLGLNWEKHIEERKDVVKRHRPTLVGSPRKLMEKTGWKPTVDLQRMIKLLLECEGAVSDVQE